MNKMSSPFTSAFVTADGIKTHYLEAGSGAPLVLIHGGGSGADSWGNWKDCIPLYAPHFRVIAVDMVGFGKTEAPDPAVYDYSQANRNKHMAAFIEALNLGPVNIIGNSMGGATTIGVAMLKPSLIKKMVLMGAAGIDVANPDPNAKKALAGYDFTREGMRRVMESLTGPNFKVDDDLLEYRYQLTLKPEIKAAMGAMKGGKLTYPEEEVAKITLPTLVVGGKDDKVAIPARNYRYLELLKNSWGFMLPHCGHWVMMEAPKEFVHITTSFFQSDMFNV